MVSTDNAVLMPWFSPALSPAVSRVIFNLGHSTCLSKGDEINVSQFRHRVVFVKRGVIAQAVLNPGSNQPFMMTLSSCGSFGVTSDAFSTVDNLSRRYWAVTSCEVLTVVPEILLRLCDVEKNWNQELHSYATRRAIAERLGLMISHVANNERRFGVFLAALVGASGRNCQHEFESNGVWIKLPMLPSRKLISTVISCSSSTLDRTIRKWINDGVFMHTDGALWMRRQALFDHWRWLKPFIQMQKEIEASVKPTTPQQRIKDLEIFKDI